MNVYDTVQIVIKWMMGFTRSRGTDTVMRFDMGSDYLDALKECLAEAGLSLVELGRKDGYALMEVRDL